jgi:hypothetical protein
MPHGLALHMGDAVATLRLLLDRAGNRAHLAVSLIWLCCWAC